MATSSSKSGPDIAGLNAKLPDQPAMGSYKPADPGDRSAAGRDAGQGAGLASGLFEKERFLNTAVEELGKPIAPMGTPPWDAPPRDTFARGHEFKNG